MAVSDVIMILSVFVTFSAFMALVAHGVSCNPKAYEELRRQQRRTSVVLVTVLLASLTVFLVEGIGVLGVNRSGSYVQIAKNTLLSKDGEMRIGRVAGVAHLSTPAYQNGVYRNWRFGWFLNIRPVHPVAYRTKKEANVNGHVYQIAKVEKHNLYPDAWMIASDLLEKTITVAEIGEDKAAVYEYSF